MTVQQVFETALQHHQAGRLREADQLYRQILSEDKKHAGALLYLGVLAAQSGRHADAVSLMSEAAALSPNFAEAHGNLGIALRKAGRPAEAISAFRRAIALRHNYFQAYGNLGNALKDQGQMLEALGAYRHALSLKPDEAGIHSNVLLALHYDPSFDAQRIAREHRQWNQQHALPLAHLVRRHSNKLGTDRRLRVGYVSPDFRDHAVARFLLPLLANHDRQSIEVFAYAHVLVPDEVTEQIRQHTSAWRSLVGLSDSQAADLIRQDQIDILVDLAGHTSDNRLLVFAQKPAPVQVTYLGYPNTTGLTTIDYRLTDAYADPPGETEALHSEQLIRLDPCAWCFSAITPDPFPERRQGGPITFGSFNSFSKVTQPMLELWSRILLAVPGSRLLLKSLGLGSESLHREIIQRLGKLGIAEDRLEIRGQEPAYIAHLCLYAGVDIALDTFPYHGTTTTCEAMSMGVPVITLAGRTHVSRVGVSLLNNVGLPELVANTAEEYVAIAVALANDRKRLAELQATLRQRMQHSPLMDASRLTRTIEAAYRQMWRRWCEAQAPAATSRPQAVPAIQQRFYFAIQQHQAGRLLEAKQLYEQILAEHPRHAGALHFSGVIAHQQGRADLGVDLIRQALALAPDYPEAYSNLGNALKDLGSLDEAIEAHRQCVALAPNSPVSQTNLGLTLLQAGRFDEAIAAYRLAIKINPRHPGGHSNLANALLSNGEVDEGMTASQQAVRLEPTNAKAHGNLGNALRDLGQAKEAIAAYRQAILLDPRLPDARLNLSLTLLSLGEFPEGWEEYEARWRAKEYVAGSPNFAQPLWDGSPLTDRVLLLHAEQGLGDSFQFIRYLPMVAQRCAQVVVECQSEITELVRSLARRCPNSVDVIPRGQALPPFDFHCPLLSLPRIFKTDLQTIPAEVPYLFPSMDLIAFWNNRLNALPIGLKIGLAWAGNPSHKGNATRSLALAQLAPLTQVRGVTFLSLQKGIAAQQVKADATGLNLIDWTDEFIDFSDAGLIANLDLIITVDTSVAHLAGALGRPTWVLLACVPDWRWLTQRSDSPWYPTMRLFRQKSRGDWSSVVNELTEALRLMTTRQRKGGPL